MTDLQSRAQSILHAAEKMTPGPWDSAEHDNFRSIGPIQIDGGILSDDDKGLLALRNDAPQLIRDLLAENERLHNERRDILATYLRLVDALFPDWSTRPSGTSEPDDAIREIERLRADAERWRGVERQITDIGSLGNPTWTIRVHGRPCESFGDAIDRSIKKRGDA